MQRVIKIACLIIILLMPSFVGKSDEYASKNFEIYDESRNRIIPTTVYYPIDGKNIPVIVISHGAGGNRNQLNNACFASR